MIIIMTTFNIAGIFLLFVTVGQGERFSTKEIIGNSGLHFEETGKILFYNREWKIVSNVNLTDYRIELNDNKNIVEIISNSCDELKSIEIAKNNSNKGNDGCGPILYQLSTVMDEIEENDDNWFGKDTRYKRNIVSELVLEDWPQDLVTFTEEFEKMSADGSRRSTSPTKRTSFISSNLNSGQKSKENNQLSTKDYVANQLSFVNSTLLAARNGSFNVVRLFQLRTTIQDIIAYQVQILNNFSLKQKQFLNILPLVGRKKPQIPHLLSSDTFTSELKKIRNIVSENGFDLPVNVAAENVFTLYHISSPEVVLLNDQIFIIFHVPLISKYSGNYFSLFKVTSSLYWIGNNLYSFVVPNHEFIAIDTLKEHYTALTVDDLKNCHQTNNLSPIICKQTSTIMSTVTSSECEISILHKGVFPDSETNNCKVRYIRNNAEIFIKVLKPNSWLVTMPKSSKIRYICEGKATEVFSVQINGLLTIGSDCQFATDNILITGHNLFPKSEINEHSNFNFTRKSDMEKELSRVILSNDGEFLSQYIFVNDIPQVVNFGENEKLLSISRGINDINSKKQYEQLIWDLQYFNKHIALLELMTVLVFTVYLLLAFIIFSDCGMKAIKSMKRKQPPIPSAPSI